MKNGMFPSQRDRVYKDAADTREKGYYWVNGYKWSDNPWWFIAKWDGNYFWHDGDDYSEGSFNEIDEQQIIRQ